MSTLAPPNARGTTSQEPAASKIKDASELAGRGLLAVLFLASGLGKIVGYAAVGAYMASLGVPSALLPVVIATEVVGALAIIAGWRTRIAAFLLAGYSILTALIFHANVADQIQLVMFLKNVSIAGGLLLLVANGAGRWSVDRRFGR